VGEDEKLLLFPRIEPRSFCYLACSEVDMPHGLKQLRKKYIKNECRKEQEGRYEEEERKKEKKIKKRLKRKKKIKIR
jgi:hypothetical protein